MHISKENCIKFQNFPEIVINDLYCLCFQNNYTSRRAKLGQIQGGVAEGHPRFDKGGVVIFFYFLRVKNRTL